MYVDAELLSCFVLFLYSVFLNILREPQDKLLTRIEGLGDSPQNPPAKPKPKQTSILEIEKTHLRPNKASIPHLPRSVRLHILAYASVVHLLHL